MVATDLDGTVIFSVHPPPVDAVVVDPPADACMTAAAAAGWERLSVRALVAPVTTRTAAQYQRLRLPGRPARYALVCNGARLLVEGEPDDDWSRQVRRRLAGSALTFVAVWEQARRWGEEYGFARARSVEEYFSYLVAARREPWLAEFAAEAAAWAGPNGWRVSLQGRKVYLMPEKLDKSVAVLRLARRLRVDDVFAGGDSLLDAGMLSVATAAILANQGELHRSGLADPRCAVTTGSGLAAGHEIVTWYGDRTGVTPTCASGGIRASAFEGVPASRQATGGTVDHGAAGRAPADLGEER